MKNNKKAAADTTIPAVPSVLYSGFLVTTKEIAAVIPNKIRMKEMLKSFALATPRPPPSIDNAPSAPAIITVITDAFISC